MPRPPRTMPNSDLPASRAAPTRRAALTGAAACLLLPATASAAGALHRAREPLFGSPTELIAAAPVAPQAAFADVLQGLRAMNRHWNAWKPGELLSLNQALRQGHSFEVSPGLQALLLGARALEQRSGGLFNAGIGGLVGAWGFHADALDPGARPSAAALAPWREATPGLAQLRIDGRRVSTHNRRLQIDLGGYAKGVAADWALDRLRQHGVADAVVDLGGNLAAAGRVDGRPWRVGVRDPLAPGVLAQLPVHGREAVVTSGIYERWRLLDGEPASHILDPRRGTPAAELVSVTVVHRSAGLADAAATALLVAGPRHWPELATRLGVRDVLVVDRRGRAFVTAALAARPLVTVGDWKGRVTVV